METPIEKINEFVVDQDLTFDIQPRLGPVGAEVTVRRRGWSHRQWIVRTGGDTVQSALERALEYLEGRG